MHELILGGHAVYDADGVHFVAELAWIRHREVGGDVVHHTTALFGELGYAVGDYTPYVRYEYTQFDGTRSVLHDGGHRVSGLSAGLGRRQVRRERERGVQAPGAADRRRDRHRLQPHRPGRVRVLRNLMMPRWPRWPRWLAWTACTCAVVTVVARADAGGFVVVKNAKNPTASVSKDAAKDVFNGHTKTWGNEEAVVLVIGSEDSPAMHLAGRRRCSACPRRPTCPSSSRTCSRATCATRCRRTTTPGRSSESRRARASWVSSPRREPGRCQPTSSVMPVQ